MEKGRSLRFSKGSLSSACVGGSRPFVTTTVNSFSVRIREGRRGDGKKKEEAPFSSILKRERERERERREMMKDSLWLVRPERDHICCVVIVPREIGNGHDERERERFRGGGGGRKKNSRGFAENGRRRRTRDWITHLPRVDRKSCSFLPLFLLQKLLNYDPKKRISAMESLSHPYFEEGETS